MKALVVYHSKYGNTKMVAESLTRGLREAGIETDCQSVDEVDLDNIDRIDFLAVGSPTHILRPSDEMKDFLVRLSALELSEIKGFAFDTRNESRMNKRSLWILENSAARSIESNMRKAKIDIIRPRESALVEGQEGPLYPQVDDTFLEIGKELGQTLLAG